MSQFVHLHNHSDFSLLDGAVPIPWYIEEAKAHGMQHLGLTDHGGMFGVLHFEQQCHAAGINPVIGCEMYTTSGSSFERTSRERNHFVLFCKNETGYKNLLKLVSHGYLDGFYYKPRIDDSLLKKYSEGLIATSACLAGAIPSLLVAGKYKEARDKALYYNDLFGHGNFYLEIMNHGIPEEDIVSQALTQISKETEIPLIATNDIHYLKKEHFNAHDILLCIGTAKNQSDPKRLKFEHNEFYFKSVEEMEALFPKVPDALSNTVLLAEKCNLTIPQPGPMLPNYTVPDSFKSQNEYLIHLAWEGISKRYKNLTQEIQERTEYELSVLTSMEYAGYFLIVWDFIDWSRKHNIPVGPGRGSGAGSIVAYAMGITDVDPLKYNLLFERFLNPERVSMPDFDIDFCNEGRDKVIEYVTHKYGQKQVGGICTFGTLKTKAVIKDVARVLEIPYDEANAITKLIPEGKTADNRKINTAVALEVTPELMTFYKRGGRYQELFDTAKILEGMNRHISTHACGKVIGRSPLTDYVPLFKDQKSGEVTTEFTMDIIEECGLVKMDFLGLKTLTVLKNTQELIRKKNPDFDLEKIEETDKPTFEMLSRGESDAVFQFESAGMQKILRDAKPSNIEDLIALNALYRPGPMDNIPEFVRGKKKPRSIAYPDPSLETILKPTYGVIVYQEQVMQVAQTVAGYSLGKADVLRRVMGKKKADEMKKMEPEFIEGAEKVGLVTAKKAKEIFDLLKPFAGYGFNKSHAAAYSLLAYKTAYCKANYPTEFMAANLTNEINSPDTYANYMSLTKRMGIEILPPHVNYSEKLFTVVDNQIYYGLLGIKGMGTAAVDELIKERTSDGLFTSFEEFMSRMPLNSLNKRMLEFALRAGLFDKVETQRDRETLEFNLQSLIERFRADREEKNSAQLSLFGDETVGSLPDFVYREPLERLTPVQRLEQEKEVLGTYLSGHPLDPYRGTWEKKSTLDLKDLKKAVAKKDHTVIGMLTSLREIFTKQNRSMGIVQVEDYRGTLDMVLFSDAYEEAKEKLTVGAILEFTGMLDRQDRGVQLKVKSVSIPVQEEGSEEKKNLFESDPPPEEVSSTVGETPLTQDLSTDERSHENPQNETPRAEPAQKAGGELHIRLHEAEYTEEKLTQLHLLLQEGIPKGDGYVFLHINDFVVELDERSRTLLQESTLTQLESSPFVEKAWIEREQRAEEVRL